MSSILKKINNSILGRETKTNQYKTLDLASDIDYQLGRTTEDLVEYTTLTNELITNYGAVLANEEYRTTDYIPIESGIWYSLLNAYCTGIAGINTYDKDFIRIKQGVITTYTYKVQQSGIKYSIKFPTNAKYVRVSFDKDNIGICGLWYGIATPQNITHKELSLVLPTTLYQIRNKKQFYYLDSMTNSARQTYLDLNIGSLSKKYNRFSTISQNITGLFDTLVTIKKDGVTKFCEYQPIYFTDPALLSGKTINKLHIGNSYADIGTYIQEINTLLSGYGVTVNEIGTKGSTSKLSESVSGGNISTFITSGRSARIITVTGVSVTPRTTYPATIYNDSNGQAWTVTGTKLSAGEGVIKLTRNSDTLGTEIPASGTFTKVSGTGDTTLTYSSFVAAYNNPFWNPATSSVDISYYTTLFGYSVPDVVEIQLSTNDMFTDLSYIDILTIINNYKILIDAIILANVDAKICLTVQPCGASPEVSTSAGSQGKYYSTIRFVELLKTEMSAYTNLIICPSYCQVDGINAYTLTNEAVNSRYSATTTVANDPVHLNEAGYKELADSVVNVLAYQIK